MFAAHPLRNKNTPASHPESVRACILLTFMCHFEFLYFSRRFLELIAMVPRKTQVISEVQTVDDMFAEKYNHHQMQNGHLPLNQVNKIVPLTVFFMLIQCHLFPQAVLDMMKCYVSSINKFKSTEPIIKYYSHKRLCI